MVNYMLLYHWDGAYGEMMISYLNLWVMMVREVSYVTVQYSNPTRPLPTVSRAMEC